MAATFDGPTLRRWRRRLKLTQREVAARVGVVRTRISECEVGAPSATGRMMARIASALLEIQQAQHGVSA